MFHHFVSPAPGMAPSICKVRSCKTTAILTSLIHIRKCDFMNSRVLGGTGQICLPQILVSIKESKWVFVRSQAPYYKSQLPLHPWLWRCQGGVFNRSHTDFRPFSCFWSLAVSPHRGWVILQGVKCTVFCAVLVFWETGSVSKELISGRLQDRWD